MKTIAICASLILAGAVVPTMAQSAMIPAPMSTNCMTGSGASHQMPATAKNRPGYRMAGSYMTPTGDVPKAEQTSVNANGMNCMPAGDMAPTHRMPAGAKNRPGMVMPGASMPR